MPSQKKLFIATSLIEIGAALPMVALPPLALWLLFGVREPSPEALIATRVGGTGLLAIAVACWLGRNDRGSSSQHGLLWAILVYNVGAATVLCFAGSISGMAGLALWPAVSLHAIMAIWCAMNLRAWDAHAKPNSSSRN